MREKLCLRLGREPTDSKTLVTKDGADARVSECHTVSFFLTAVPEQTRWTCMALRDHWITSLATSLSSCTEESSNIFKTKWLKS